MFRKINHAGFGHIFALLCVVVLGVIGLAVYMVMKNSSPKKDTPNVEKVNQQSVPQEEPKVTLQNLGITSINDIDITNQAVREFASQGLKGFYIFGDKLSGGRTNPNFEYASLNPTTKIVSSIDGIVGFVKEQSDSNDYEVFIQPKEGSKWTIGYDHVTKVAVKKGDTVKAGDILGEPAMQNNGLLRFEMQINYEEGGETTHYCPSLLLAASVKDMWLADLKEMQSKWESTTKLELYDIAKQNPVGCIVSTLTPQQAEQQ